MNASGCGVTVKEYGHSLAHDPALRDKARAHRRADARPERAAARLVPALTPQLRRGPRPRSPSIRPARCSTASSCAAASRRSWRALGFEVASRSSEAHLCCGSAGTYSVLQPELADELRDRKLAAPAQALQPQAIVSANIGCIPHLQGAAPMPVRHWIELLDEALAA